MIHQESKTLILLLLIFCMPLFAMETAYKSEPKGMTMSKQQDENFIDDVMNLIQATYPQEWLSKIFTDPEGGGLEIIHPNNNEYYLSVDIWPNQVAIAVLREDQRDILIDLAGFNFSFNKNQMNDIQTFFNNHYQTGVAQ